MSNNENKKSAKIYHCCRCNKYCCNKSVLRKHLQKKFICNASYKDISQEVLLDKLNKNEYIEFYNNLSTKKKCIYCNNVYSRSSTLKRHMSVCEFNTNLANYKNIEHNTINNININNNIYILNNLGKEDYSNVDFDKLLFMDPKNYDKLSLINKSNNYVHNLKSIMSDIYTNNANINFQLVNKREQKCKVKIDDKISSMHFSEIFFIVFDNIVNIYENYLNKNKEKLQHYINYLQEMSKQLDIYESDIENKKAKDFFIINNKIKKFLKNTLMWIAEDNVLNIES